MALHQRWYCLGVERICIWKHEFFWLLMSQSQWRPHEGEETHVEFILLGPSETLLHNEELSHPDSNSILVKYFPNEDLLHIGWMFWNSPGITNGIVTDDSLQHEGICVQRKDSAWAAVSPSDGKCAPRYPGLCTWMTSSQTSPRARRRCSHAASLYLQGHAGAPHENQC